MSPHDITVAIPAHWQRVQSGMLARACGSAVMQTHAPAALSVAMDLERQGAPATRQRALDAVQTPWVAFLDSDDMFYPEHLKSLLDHALETGADYVYSYWDTKRTPDVLGHFGKPFDHGNPTETTITILVRTDLAKDVGFQALTDRQENTGEDWRFTLECIKRGAMIMHLPKQTWYWAHHGGNTSGMPNKGDAR